MKPGRYVAASFLRGVGYVGVCFSGFVFGVLSGFSVATGAMPVVNVYGAKVIGLGLVCCGGFFIAPMFAPGRLDGLASAVAEVLRSRRSSS